MRPQVSHILKELPRVAHNLHTKTIVPSTEEVQNPRSIIELVAGQSLHSLNCRTAQQPAASLETEHIITKTQIS